MSPEYLDSMAIAPSNNIYERLEGNRREIENEIMHSLRETDPKITWLQIGGDSLGHGLDVRLKTESALESAAQSGFLKRVAELAYAAVSKRLQLTENAQIKFCFNSDEYVHARGDAFGRAHDGDWRTTFVLTVDAKGNFVSNA